MYLNQSQVILCNRELDIFKEMPQCFTNSWYQNLSWDDHIQECIKENNSSKEVHVHRKDILSGCIIFHFSVTWSQVIYCCTTFCATGNMTLSKKCLWLAPTWFWRNSYFWPNFTTTMFCEGSHNVLLFFSTDSSTSSSDMSSSSSSAARSLLRGESRWIPYSVRTPSSSSSSSSDDSDLTLQCEWTSTFYKIINHIFKKSYFIRIV